ARRDLATATLAGGAPAVKQENERERKCAPSTVPSSERPALSFPHVDGERGRALPRPNRSRTSRTRIGGPRLFGNDVRDGEAAPHALADREPDRRADVPTGGAGGDPAPASLSLHRRTSRRRA